MPIVIIRMRNLSRGSVYIYNPARQASNNGRKGDLIQEMRNTCLSGACDCHVHVVESLDQFPQVANRSYTAGPATLESIRKIAAPACVTRFVFVQARFYATDK